MNSSRQIESLRIKRKHTQMRELRSILVFSLTPTEGSNKIEKLMLLPLPFTDGFN